MVTARSEGPRLGFSPKLVVIALFGVLVRTMLMLTVTRHKDLGFDAAYYSLLARALAHGHGFVDPFALYIGHRVRPTALYPPGYPVVLAAFARVGMGSRTWRLFVGCGLGGVSIVLCGRLARHFLSERPSLVVAALAAVYPMLVGADASGMSEALYLPLILVALLLAMRCSGPRAWPWALLGVTIGLAALTRDEGLVYLFVLAIPSAIVAEGTALRRAALFGLTAVGVVGVLAPWMIRNDLAFGHPVLIANSSSTTLGGANCRDTYYGGRLGSWSYPCLNAHRPGAARLSETTLNDQIRREGLSYMEHHAARVPFVVLVRLVRTYGLYDDTRAYAADLGAWFTLGWLMYLALLPFAIVGAVVIRRRRADLQAQELVALLAPVVAVTLVTIASYGSPRFRIAAEPVVLVLAVVGGGALVRHHRPRRDRFVSRSGLGAR